MKNLEACNVCGCEEVNLVDGFYYCVECGTQDVNVQETIVEYATLQDGTLAHTTTKKIVLPTNVQMSAEWYKWHTFNFILNGLADELVELGAAPSFRTKLLWIWSKYINMYRNTENDSSTVGSGMIGGQENNNFQHSDDDVEKSDDDVSIRRQMKYSYRTEMKIVTIAILQAMIYVALNLDESEIQLSDLCRFVREERISTKTCLKFVPKEIKCNEIKWWRNFLSSLPNLVLPRTLREFSMTLYKKLDLGTPTVPDIKKLVERFIMELCLPSDFKDLVFSLMKNVRCDPLLLANQVRMPDYDSIAISYILLALKMCFGLDDSYERKLSEAVDHINEVDKRAKCFKDALFIETTNRLFSFQKWANYMEFRKHILAKHYFPIAIQNNIATDDQVFISQTVAKNKESSGNITDDVIMKILDKIPANVDAFKKSKVDFEGTLTPLTDYTAELGGLIKDPEVKEMLMEDFSRYSLGYITKDLNLKIDNKNILIGINETIDVKPKIYGNLRGIVTDKSMVYVRACDNKHWYITKPPNSDHIKDDNLNETDMEENEVSNFKFEEDNNVFDDSFDNADVTYSGRIKIEPDESPEHADQDICYDMNVNDYCKNEQTSPEFDSESFDREEAIKQLLLLTCRDNKLTIPKELQQPKKARQLLDVTIETDRPRKLITTNRHDKGTISSNAKIANEIITAYITKKQNDIISDMLQSTVLLNQDNETANQIDHETVNQIDHETVNQIDQESINQIDQETVSQIDQETVNQIDQETVSQIDEHDDVICNDNSDEFSSEEVTNDNFDKNIYDLRQLYLKYNKDDIINDTIIDPDVEIQKYISKLVDRDINIDSSDKRGKKRKKSYSKSDSDEDDDIPLSLYRNSFLSQTEESPLLNIATELHSYKYWIRHYSDGLLAQNDDISIKFEAELNCHFPKSFVWVLRLCSTILETSALHLYIEFAKLEDILMSYCKS